MTPHTPDPDEALVERVRCALAGTDPEGRGDNLAILFCEIFEHHPDCPEADAEDLDDFGWNPWATARADAALDMLARAALAELSKPLNGLREKVARAIWDGPLCADFTWADVVADPAHSAGVNWAFDVADCALAAMPSACPADGSGWMPIETAPKDGTRFLAYQKDRALCECWWQEDFSNWSGWLDDADSEPEPTHWMPLPAPPAAHAPETAAEPPARSGEEAEG